MPRSTPQRHALIAETAFLLASSAFAGDSYSREEVEEKARDFPLKLPRGAESRPELTPAEWHDVGSASSDYTEIYFPTSRARIFTGHTGMWRG